MNWERFIIQIDLGLTCNFDAGMFLFFRSRLVLCGLLKRAAIMMR